MGLKMKILNKEYAVDAVFGSYMTVPDCFVVNSNKIGGGHGESKFYVAPKEEMYNFYGHPGFVATCIMLKTDLVNYMNAIKSEYVAPTQDYRGKDGFPSLWEERMEKISRLPDVIDFKVKDQVQIAGDRGYVNSDDDAYQLIREVSLPLVSYISVMRLRERSGTLFFYWRLFVDFEALSEKTPLVFLYGRKEVCAEPKVITEKRKQIIYARNGQGKYRSALLEMCPFCPITKVSDDRLLIASHIKPWAVSSDIEKIDPHNGYILSPMYDKLFDKGFITFTEDKRMLVSNMLSAHNQRLIGISNNMKVPLLPVSPQRLDYLKFHHMAVFNGVVD